MLRQDGFFLLVPGHRNLTGIDRVETAEAERVKTPKWSRLPTPQEIAAFNGLHCAYPTPAESRRGFKKRFSKSLAASARSSGDNEPAN